MFRGFARAVTKRHVERKVVNAPPQHLFRVVTDVDRYQEFLAFCSHSKILSSWDSGKRFEATVSIEVPPFVKETYVSSVKVIPETFRVEIRSIESSVFDSLRSHWQLRPIEGQENKVDAELEVEISTSDPFLSISLGTLVEQIASMQVKAFETRCRQIPIHNASAQ